MWARVRRCQWRPRRGDILATGLGSKCGVIRRTVALREGAGMRARYLASTNSPGISRPFGPRRGCRARRAHGGSQWPPSACVTCSGQQGRWFDKVRIYYVGRGWHLGGESSGARPFAAPAGSAPENKNQAIGERRGIAAPTPTTRWAVIRAGDPLRLSAAAAAATAVAMAISGSGHDVEVGVRLLIRVTRKCRGTA